MRSFLSVLALALIISSFSSCNVLPQGNDIIYTRETMVTFTQSEPPPATRVSEASALPVTESTSDSETTAAPETTTEATTAATTVTEATTTVAPETTTTAAPETTATTTEATTTVAETTTTATTTEATTQTAAPETTAPPETTARRSSQAPSSEVRAVWISYLEYERILKGVGQSQFKNNIDKMFANISATGLNTVIVQVRPYGDALYSSDYFPWSYYITGTEGQNPGFDPLQIMIDYAHSYGLKIEAWINPYRIRAGSNSNPLSANNPAQAFLNSGSAEVIKYGSGIYYNPASANARQIIVDGVVEIIRNYDVDAIHFDDYFYPTTDTAFDKSDYTAYQNNGGKLSLGDFRRENVNKLVAAVHNAIKTEDSRILFGISPQGNMSNNYSVQFIDVRHWVDNDYIDYICPQIYWGFNHQSAPYAKLVSDWNSLVEGSGVRLYAGIGAYRVGTVDSGAGSGKNEWVNSKEILSRMIEESRLQSAYKGFALYRYDSIFTPSSAVKNQVNAELKAIEELLN